MAAAVERVELGGKAKARLRTLSGGMLRRVGIAQAIVNEPELLLLDEPTAGLDPEQRVAFRALLRDLGQRATVVVSTHLVEDVGAACAQVALMDQGKIVFHGTPAELTARGEGHGDRRRAAGARLQRGPGGGTVMTAAIAPAASRPVPAARRPALAAARLLRLELRHNAMLWMLPVAVALFWLTTYRKAMAMPPLWNLRAASHATRRRAGLRCAGGRRGRVDGVAGSPPPHHRPGERSPPGRGGPACSPPGPPPPAGPWWATWSAWPSCTG